MKRQPTRYFNSRAAGSSGLPIGGCFLLLWLVCLGEAKAQLPFFLRVARQPTNLTPVVGSSTGAKVNPVQAVAKKEAGLPQPPGGAPWVVFSDRSNNNTFRNANGTVPFRKMGFMEAFYVLKERNGYLKVIKYDPALPIGNKFSRRVITDRKAVVYYGWAPKNRFLLANQSSRSADQRRAQLFSAVLAQPSMLTQADRYFTHDSVRMFADPGQQLPIPPQMRLYDLAYVYKLSDTRRQALIGRASWFPTDSIKQTLLGWVPVDILQTVGQRLFLEADTVHFAAQPIPLYRTLSASLARRSDSTVISSLFPMVAWNRLGAKFPVLSRYFTRDSQTVVQTNVLTPLLVRRQVPVLNVNGQRITSQVLTNVQGGRNRYNLIYVIEGSPAMQPYWGELLNTIQFTITQLTQDTTRTIDLQVGSIVYNDYEKNEPGDRKLAGSVLRTQLTTNYSRVLNELKQGTPPFEARPSAAYKGIRLGVGEALKLFSGHPDENNILVLVGINGDIESVANGTLVAAALKKVECRLLAFQVYAGSSNVSNNFVLHARDLALLTANEGSELKKARLVRPDMVTPANEFNLRMGDRNVYQLAYPERSMVPGWILFPRKNQTLPFRELYGATDSLFQQVAHESKAVVTALEKTFQRLEPLGDQVNPRLASIYAAAGMPLPANASALTRFDDYPYQTRAFTPLAIKGGPRWKYLALLPLDEYDGVGRWLDQLSGDDIDPAGYLDRLRLLHRYRQVLSEAGLSAETTVTLDQLLYGLLDLPVSNPLFKRIVIGQLTSARQLPDALLNQVLYLLRERRDYFRRIPTFRNSRFSSNGRTYYWISEDLFN